MRSRLTLRNYVWYDTYAHTQVIWLYASRDRMNYFNSFSDVVDHGYPTYLVVLTGFPQIILHHPNLQVLQKLFKLAHPILTVYCRPQNLNTILTRTEVIPFSLALRTTSEFYHLCNRTLITNASTRLVN